MPLHLLISGLPGRMAAETCATALEHREEFNILPQALSGHTTTEKVLICKKEFELLSPQQRESIELPHPLIAIDFSSPAAAIPNIRWFVQRHVPFIMGTTGFNGEEAQRIVETGTVPAVIAPNMAVPIILIQSAIEHLARNYPGTLAGYSFVLRESHQQGKKDTSGTAKALAKEFALLGLPASAASIEQTRNPTKQRELWNVPEEHLPGHAYHHYEANSSDGSVNLTLGHRIHGRRVYADGALMAVRFLAKRMNVDPSPRIYTMEDVLRVG